MLLFLTHSIYLGAQDAGYLVFGPVSPPDLSSGMQRCTVKWENNGVNPARGLNITISLSGTEVCLDQKATKNSVQGFASPPYTISATDNSVSIVRIPTTPALSLATNYIPLVVLHFRAAPGTQVNIASTIAVVVTNEGAFRTITPGSTSTTTFPGFTVGGQVQKLGGTSCQGGANNGIPNTTLVMQGQTNGQCFPGITYASTIAWDGSYTFTDEFSLYSNYILSPQKADGCECGEGSPVNNIDIDIARGWILGMTEPDNTFSCIRADYNGNKSVTAHDLHLMQECMLGLLEGTEWRFVHTNVPNMNVLLTTPGLLRDWPAVTSTAPLVSYISGENKQEIFIGYRIGDVDQSCSLCGGPNFTGQGSGDRETKQVLRTNIEPLSLGFGEVRSIPVRLESANGIVVFDMELGYDPNLVEIVSVEPGLSGENVSNYRIKPQSVLAAWTSMERNGVSTKGGSDVVCYVQVRARCPIGNIQQALWLAPFSKYNHVIWEESRNRGMFVANTADTDKSFAIRLASANPSNALSFLLEACCASEKEAEIWITNSTGSIVYHQSGLSVQTGWNQFKVEQPDAVSGIYTIHIAQDGNRKSLKFVKY